MAELRDIVQSMVDSGETEENIAAVIKRYNALNKPAAQEDFPADEEKEETPQADASVEGDVTEEAVEEDEKGFFGKSFDFVTEKVSEFADRKTEKQRKQGLGEDGIELSVKERKVRDTKAASNVGVNADGYHFRSGEDETIDFLKNDFGYNSKFNKETGLKFKFTKGSSYGGLVDDNWIVAIAPNGQKKNFKTDHSRDSAKGIAEWNKFKKWAEKNGYDRPGKETYNGVEFVAPITHDQLTDNIPSFVNVPAADKEAFMVKNLEKHYKGEGITFEVKDVLGSNDIIVAKSSWDSEYLHDRYEIDTRKDAYKENPEKYLRGFNAWMQARRKQGQWSEDDAPTNEETDALTAHLASVTGSYHEDNDTKIKSLQSTIDNASSGSQKKLDAIAELEAYKSEINEREFDQSGERSRKLAEKYNAKMKKMLDGKKRYMESKGIKEGSDEWNKTLKEEREWRDSIMGKGELADIEDYQGTYEDRQALSEGKTNK